MLTPELLTGLIVALASAVAAFVLVRALTTRRAPVGAALLPVQGDVPSPLPAGLPPLGTARQCWQVATPQARSATAARLAALVGAVRPVLLLPDPAGRATLQGSAGPCPGVRWLEETAPSVPVVLASVEALARIGRPLVVVDGTDTLAGAGSLGELLEALDVPAVVVLADDQSPPNGWATAPIEPGLLEAG